MWHLSWKYSISISIFHFIIRAKLDAIGAHIPVPGKEEIPPTIDTTIFVCLSMISKIVCVCLGLGIFLHLCEGDDEDEGK